MDEFIKDTYIYTSYDVAMYAASIFRKHDIPLNRIMIQRHMYIIYAMYLAVYEARLINEHPIIEFDRPFFPELDEDLMNQTIGDNKIHVSNESMAEMTQDVKLNDIINFVVRHFGYYPPVNLDNVVCTGPAINNANTEENLKFGGYMSDEDIRDSFWFYKKIYMNGY